MPEPRPQLVLGGRAFFGTQDSISTQTSGAQAFGCYQCPLSQVRKNKDLGVKLRSWDHRASKGRARLKHRLLLPASTPHSPDPRHSLALHRAALWSASRPEHCLTPPVPGHQLPDSPASACRLGLDGQSALIRVESSQERVPEGKCSPMGPRCQCWNENYWV